MKWSPGVVGFLLLCGLGRSGEVRFTKEPTAGRAGEGMVIAFAVSEPTDVEVAILDAKGAVARHLAAGLLGKNAPPPLKPDALSQTVPWDGRDDDGKPATGGPFKARVAIGVAPKLDKLLGWDGNTVGSPIVGLAVGTDGELYVLSAEAAYGRSEVRVLDRDGKYLRTIMPYPANLTRDQTAPIGHLEVEGERLPVVFNAHGHNLAPLTSGMKKQTMAFSPRGHLLMASAVGTIVEHGPPRHVLALTPEGAPPPGLGFVGPQFLPARNFLGGSGDGFGLWFDHLASSPDGEWIYLTTYGESWSLKRRHVVFRLKWTDKGPAQPFLGKDEAGDDDGHFNDPQGIATDAKGNLCVCDRGNNRVMLFSPEGKLLGKLAVAEPEQIAIHPKTGEVYIVSRKAGKRVTETKLLKFAPWSGGEAKEVARVEGKTFDVIALDPQASPPRLWAALNMGYGKPMTLVPITDRGNQLEAGAPANNQNGLSYPMFLAADAARERAYVTEFREIQKLLDLKTGRLGFFKKGNETALDRDGNVYLLTGYEMTLERYGPEGKPLPFPALGTHKIPLPDYKSKGPCVGLRGHAVARNGDIYVLRMGFYTTGRVDVFAPDGKLKKEGLLARVVHGSSGLGLDPAGNLYLGSNLKPAEGSPIPSYFAGKVPETGWVWWRQKREAPWCYPYYNSYLYHGGAVFKFPPTGGEFFGGRGDHEIKEDQKKGLPPDPKAPDGTPRYKTGYLNLDAWVKGALWRCAGYGPVPASGLNWGDPSCTCWTARLAVDDYGRVFVPNVFRFSVEMLDTNGNHIARIGRYGNADSAGPGSRVPEPDIPFAWPAFTSVAGGKLYVSDPVNNRIVVVRFGHAAAAECPLP